MSAVEHAKGGRPSWAPPILRGDRLEAGLRTLEFDVRRRLDGLLQGNHIGLVPGPGSEPGEARPYQAGDDVRRIDWAATARMGAPQLRETIADRELETWLVADLSPSLDFGTSVCEKRDLVVCAVAAMAHLAGGGGNRIGLVMSNGSETVRMPARSGPGHARRVVRTVAQMPRADVGTRGDLEQLVEQLRRPPRRRGLAVVISDFLGSTSWARPFRGLSARHDLMAVEVLDPRDVDLPDVGSIVLADPETGKQREVNASALLRKEFGAAAQAHRTEVAGAVRQAGAGHLVLRTDSDWIADVVRFVMSRKRGWTGASR